MILHLQGVGAPPCQPTSRGARHRLEPSARRIRIASPTTHTLTDDVTLYDVEFSVNDHQSQPRPQTSVEESMLSETAQLQTGIPCFSTVDMSALSVSE